jgi:hypothetical protein
MIFLMNLIYESFNSGIVIRYYEGIDFNIVLKHPKDGSRGMLIFFIEKWQDEVIKWRRENKINKILGDNYIESNLYEIENNFIAIYQSDGVSTKEIYEVIRKKVESGNLPNQPWTPVNGIENGAWKIKKFKNII